jgi:LPS sulfotransferase NodH
MENDNQVAPYVIVFLERSGSTYLSELLMSHPDVHAELEIFATIIARRKKHRWSLPEASETQLRWAEDFFRLAPRPGVRAWGFKTKLKDILDRSGFRDVVRAAGARVVVLCRRNQVKSVVSLMNAIRLNEQSGDWNLRDGGTNVSSPLVVDPVAFARTLEGFSTAIGAIKKYGRELSENVLELEYEDLLTNPQPSLERICAFLQVPFVPMRTALRKNTSDDLRTVLQNFEELRARYTGTPYEVMFDEVLAPPEP